MKTRLSVVPAEGIESRADRIRRLQDQAAEFAAEGINAGLDAVVAVSADLRSYSGDDMKVVPAGIRDALLKLANEIDSRVLSIKQIGGRS